MALPTAVCSVPYLMIRNFETTITPTYCNLLNLHRLFGHPNHGRAEFYPKVATQLSGSFSSTTHPKGPRCLSASQASATSIWGLRTKGRRSWWSQDFLGWLGFSWGKVQFVGKKIRKAEVVIHWTRSMWQCAMRTPRDVVPTLDLASGIKFQDQSSLTNSTKVQAPSGNLQWFSMVPSYISAACFLSPTVWFFNFFHVSTLRMQEVQLTWDEWYLHACEVADSEPSPLCSDVWFAGGLTSHSLQTWSKLMLKLNSVWNL